MKVFHQTGFIDAPVEKVFAYISDFTKIPEWRPDVPNISRISGETKLGTTFWEEVRLISRNPILMKVIEFVPNKRLVIQGQTGMSLLPTQSFSFAADGDKTRIDLLVTMKVSGFYKLMEFMLPSQLRKFWVRYFENLNRILSK